MARMKRRLAMRGTISPGNIEFHTDWKPLRKGPRGHQGYRITSKPTAKMIVFDTLGRVAPIAGNYIKTQTSTARSRSSLATSA